MDEPTATLTPGETERLFGLIKAQQTVASPSHLAQARRSRTDHRRGDRDARWPVRHARCDKQPYHSPNGEPHGGSRDLGLVSAQRRSRIKSKPRCYGCGLDRARLGAGWAFDVFPGEILGFAGLVGAGRTELFEGLLGLREHQVERIELEGRSVVIRSPRRRPITALPT